MLTLQTQFHGLAEDLDTRDRGSAQANSMREAYSLQEIKDMIGGGGGDLQSVLGAGSTATSPDGNTNIEMPITDGDGFDLSWSDGASNDTNVSLEAGGFELENTDGSKRTNLGSGNGDFFLTQTINSVFTNILFTTPIAKTNLYYPANQDQGDYTLPIVIVNGKDKQKADPEGSVDTSSWFKEELIPGTLIEDDLSGAVSKDLDTFSDARFQLVGNTDLSFTELPNVGKTIIKTLEINSTSGQALQLPVSWTIIGTYDTSGVINYFTIKFSNGTLGGATVLCEIYQA